MLFKLALRNVKRTASSYIIYFITVALTVAFMFAANNVLLSDDLRTTDAVVRSDLGLIINIVLAVVVIIVGIIICSATAYLLRLRRREFGTYLLLGMKRGDVIKIFAVEHLTVGMVSLTAGLILGVGVFYAFNGLICAVIGSGIRPLSLMPVPSLQTLLEWACIFAVALLYSAVKLRALKISDLVTARPSGKRTPHWPAVEAALAALLLAFIVGDFVYFIDALGQVMTADGWGTDEAYMRFLISFPACTALLLAAVFLFYVCMRGVFVWRLRGKKESTFVKQPSGGERIVTCVRPSRAALKGGNVFYYRQMSGAMNRNAVMMGAIAVLLILSVMLSDYAFAQRYITLAGAERPFDIEVGWSVQRQTEYDYDLPDRALKAARSYSDTEFELLFDVCLADEPLRGELDLAVVRESDMNAMLAGAGEEEIEVADSTFYILYGYKGTVVNPDGTREEQYGYDGHIAEGETRVLYGNELAFAGAEQDGTVLRYARGSGDSGVIVVPDYIVTDAVTETYLDERVLLLNTADPVYSSAFDEYADGGYSVYVSSVYDEIDYINVNSSVLIVSALLAALIFMCISMALLSIKAMSDADADKKRYMILNMLGVSVKRQRLMLLRQLLSFSLLPVALPLLSSVPMAIIGSIICSFYLGYVHSAIIGISIAVPLVYLGIYLCYLAATYFLAEKTCIRPLERTRPRLLI